LSSDRAAAFADYYSLVTPVAGDARDERRLIWARPRTGAGL